MKQFDNVKYIKLDTGIIPTKYYYVKQDTSLNSTDISLVSHLNLTNNPANSTFNLSSIDVSGSFAVIDITDISKNGYTRYIRFGEVQIYPNIVSNVYEFSFTYTNPNSILYPPVSQNIIARYKLQLLKII